MNISIITSNLSYGGTELQLFLLLKFISKKHTIKIFCLTKEQNQLHNQYLSLGIELHYIRAKKPILKFLSLFYYIIKQKTDILFSSHFYTSAYVGILGLFFSIPSIGSVRSNGIIEKKKHPFLSYLCIHLPTIILANSHHAIQNIIHNFKLSKNKVIYFPNSVECENLIKNKNYSKPFKILFVGRLIKSKNPFLFLKIIHLLHKNNIPIQVKIIGEGNLKNTLIKKIEIYNLHKIITLVGKVKNIKEIMKQSDFLISTSKIEGTPNVILEAFSIGLPVLSTYYNGIEEIIQNENGFILNHHQEFINFFNHIHTHKINDVRQKAFNFVSKNFTLQKKIEVFEKHLLSISK